MRCSYCKSEGHRINDCQKCPIDRAIEIFNNKQDPLANKRKKQIQKYIGRHPETWFKECDKYPSELGVWNSKVLYDMLNNNDNWYAEYYVILILCCCTSSRREGASLARWLAWLKNNKLCHSLGSLGAPEAHTRVSGLLEKGGQ